MEKLFAYIYVRYVSRSMPTGSGACAGNNMLHMQKRRVSFFVEKVMSIADNRLYLSKIMFAIIVPILMYPV
ncbi:hypothetical protein [Pinibacter soli]|uniref:Uncharacterized protein n=1 Tax=Pinibacter soli TaxID=3044211 RepID=A0ABT6R9P4_9BACT|nr:hypothetical protein [Pinibacter soli]MDI3319279.1 hypothetical protein [Pinibacter soli]